MIERVGESAPQQNITSTAAASQQAGAFSEAMRAADTATDLDAIFARASEKYGVPVELLKAVGKAESGFRADAVSSCGAQGVMQLMPATSKSMGVSDPFDPEQNIMGGAQLLSQLLKKYDGDTTLALAAYNAGSGNVAKYGGVPPFKETQGYIKKVMGYLGEDLTAGTITTSGSRRSASGANAVLRADSRSDGWQSELELFFWSKMMDLERRSDEDKDKKIF